MFEQGPTDHGLILTWYGILAVNTVLLVVPAGLLAVRVPPQYLSVLDVSPAEGLPSEQFLIEF